MKQKHIQSKYVIKDGRIEASQDSRYLAPASWLVAQLVAKEYEKNIPKYCRGTLLDLGCGNSPLYDAYKKYTEKVIRADWGKSAHKDNNIDIECNLIEDLPFENERFNTILLSDVLEHIPNPEHLFKEMYRVLQMNGYIIMNTPFMYPLHEEPYDYCRYTEHYYREVAKKYHFQVVRLDRIGDELDVYADIKGKLLGKKFKNIPVARWYEQLQYKYDRIRKYPKVSCMTLGYFLVLRKI